MNRFSRTLVLCILVSWPANAALAQNLHTSRLYEQILENVGLALENHTLDSFGIVRINQGEAARINLDVPLGVSVQIMGDCDEDCVDLDLMAYDAQGGLLAEDRLEDFYPIVNFLADDIERVEIVLDLVDCSASYCYAAYSVFIGE